MSVLATWWLGSSCLENGSYFSHMTTLNPLFLTYICIKTVCHRFRSTPLIPYSVMVVIIIPRTTRDTRADLSIRRPIESLPGRFICAHETVNPFPDPPKKKKKVRFLLFYRRPLRRIKVADPFVLFLYMFTLRVFSLLLFPPLRESAVKTIVKIYIAPVSY